MKNVLRTLIASAIVALSLASGDAAAQGNAPSLPTGHGRFIMVLHEPGTRRAPDRVIEPDVQGHGGTVISSQGNERVIHLPLQAVAALRSNPNVAYVQRVWMGEPLESFAETAAEELRVAEKTDPPTWETGTYLYDGSGNIKQIGDDSYRYDSAGRLVQATVKGTTETYAYDPFGNLTAKTLPNEPSSVPPIDSTSNRIIGEAYDAAGNVTSRKGNVAYFYDSVGMATMILTDGGQARRMIYTTDDERIGLQLDSSMVRWKVRDLNGSHVIREFSGAPEETASWMWVEDYVHADGILVGAERESYFGGKRHFHLDHLGSVRLITGETGLAYGRHDYFPFGQEATLSVQEVTNLDYQRPDPMKFTSHERDFMGPLNAENRDYVDYMHARFYAPGWGRFLSVDPVIAPYVAEIPQAWNRYSYALNNPILLIDPTGLMSECFPAEIVGPDGKKIRGMRCIKGEEATVTATADDRSGGGGGGTTLNFPTQDAAAIEAIRIICADSVKEGLEYGGEIYQTRTGFRFGAARRGGPTSMAHVQGGNSVMSADVFMNMLGPPGFKLVGTYHTHGKERPGYATEAVSDGDKKIARQERLVSYVGTPRGGVLKHDPITGVIRDPRKPEQYIARVACK